MGKYTQKETQKGFKLIKVKTDTYEELKQLIAKIETK